MEMEMVVVTLSIYILLVSKSPSIPHSITQADSTVSYVYPPRTKESPVIFLFEGEMTLPSERKLMK